jgi:hypothetical protein
VENRPNPWCRKGTSARLVPELITYVLFLHVRILPSAQLQVAQASIHLLVVRLCIVIHSRNLHYAA